MTSVTGEPVGSVTRQPVSSAPGGLVGSVTRQPADSTTRLPVASLLGVLARASSPAERIAGGWLRPAGDPAIAQLRLTRWSQRIADGRPERIAEVLAEHGLTVDQWLVGLSDVTAVPGEPLPDWAQDAMTLLDQVGSEPGPHSVPLLREVVGEGLPDWVNPDQPWRFHPGFRDWMAAAAREVHTWSTAEPIFAPISEMARHDLVLDLARRQLVVSGPLLMQAAADPPSGGPLFASDARGDWEALWSTHPVIARLLATAWRQWRETTAELCGRIVTDLPTVCPGVEVTRIDLSAGDQHHGGRGVTRLRLSDGTSVFLKPRSDGLHRVLGAVLAMVDANGTPLGLSPAESLPDIIEGDGYVWVREVSRGDCRDDDAVDAYFWRAGALLRVVQAMGATDLHHENFIPTGDLPVLVDLETVVDPGPLRTAPPEDPVSARLSDTPGPTSMVTSVVSGPPGRVTADIGALAGPDEVLTPYAVRTLVQTAVGPELQSTRAPMINGSALPRRAGRPVSLRGHEQALIDGYAEAQRRLALLVAADAGPADHVPFFNSVLDPALDADLDSDRDTDVDTDLDADLDSDLDTDLDTFLDPALDTFLDPDLDPVPAVRFVARPTRIYAQLLAQSMAPVALVDGVEREFVLELLYRATGTAPPGLIACEAEGVRELDVPMFTVPFTRPDLVSDRGEVLPNALTEAPAVRTRNRLRAVAARDDRVDDLRATLFTMDPDEQASPGIRISDGPSSDRAARHVDRSEPVAMLLDRAIDVGDGTLAWIGLGHDPNRNRWTYGRMGPGLTGQAGIGLALATVAGSAAAAAKAGRAAAVNAERATAPNAEFDPGPSAEYTTGHIAGCVSAPVADCAAAARAALLGSVQRIGRRGNRGPADAFSGPAGVLYATAVAARLLNDAVLLDAARSLVVPCLRAARRDQPSVVIDGAAGAILALLHLPQDAVVADALTELADMTGLAGIPRAHADVDSPDSWSASLPSRAYGIALARHRLARIRPQHPDNPHGRTELPVPAGPGDEIASATMCPATVPSEPVSADASLRVLLDHALLAQAALHSGGDDTWAARRDQVVDVIVSRRARTGRWSAPLIAPDTALLSPVHGMAALSLLCPNLGPDVPIARALT